MGIFEPHVRHSRCDWKFNVINKTIKSPPIGGFFYSYEKTACIYETQSIKCGSSGVVAQLVRASACHAEGRGFEPRQSRQRHWPHRLEAQDTALSRREHRFESGWGCQR